MTPDLLLLSRAVVALPGAPAPGRVWVLGDTDDDGGCRDDSGIRWAWDDEQREYRIPDLTDAATGGVMLAALGFFRGGRYGGTWRIEVENYSVETSTLAAACARVMVARGRWA